MKYKIATKKKKWYDIPLCNHVNTYDIITNLEKKCKQARNQNGRIKCKQIKKYFRNKKFK